MDFITAIILGIVEGITEFLPISSTGHLLITENLLRIHKSDAFNVLIQVGPIFAVTLVFWKDIWRMITGLGEPKVRDEIFKLATAFIITGILGVIAKKLGLKLPETVLPIAVATFVGGFVIFAVERFTNGKTHSETATWGVAIAVALAQIVAAVFPGTSRSGATVMAALLLGLSRPAAVRFAFLVGIPTMFAAGALQLKDAVKDGQTAALLAPDTIIAFAVATVTAWLSVVWLLKFIRSNTFIPFAWYRVGLGLAMFAMLAFGIMK